MAKTTSTNSRPTSSSSSTAASAATSTFDAAARALREEIVRNTPAHPRAWLAWAATIAGVAARDSAKLTRVPLEDGRLTPAEILELAPLVEYVRAAKSNLDAAPALPRPLTPAESALLSGVRDDQKTIIRAFRTLRFRRNRVGLALIASLVRGVPDDPHDAAQDNTGLLSLCNGSDHESWLASLPGGEGDAAKRLWDRHNDLVALAARASHPSEEHAAREQTQRLWTLLRLRLERVLIAGRYLTAASASRRGDYRGFRRPTTKR